MSSYNELERTKHILKVREVINKTREFFPFIKIGIVYAYFILGMNQFAKYRLNIENARTIELTNNAIEVSNKEVILKKKYDESLKTIGSLRAQIKVLQEMK